MALHLSSTDTTALIGLLVAIGADTLAGILVAVIKGTFKLSFIANFVQTSVLPYVGGALVLAILAATNPSQFDAPFLAAVSAAGLKFLGDIYSKLQGLGVPVETPTTTTTPKA